MERKQVKREKKDFTEVYGDKLIVSNLETLGYGNAYKVVSMDRRLTIEAKAIFNYFSSYCGAGTTVSFPKVDTIIYHLNISKDRYYKHFKLLVDYGYIAVAQTYTEEGTFSSNEYTINKDLKLPEELIGKSKRKRVKNTQNTPSPENKDTVENEQNQKVEPSPENTDTDNPYTDNSNTENPSTDKQDSNINTFSNINKAIKNSSQNNQSINPSIDDGQNEAELQIYFDNMEIDKLQEDSETIEALKEVVRDMYYAHELKIDGSIRPHSVVISVISKLNILHLEYALKQFYNASKMVEIKNPKAYMITTIYNAVINNQFGIQAQVNFDLNNN